MSYLELSTTQANIFSGMQKTFDEAKYVILGVPFDGTSSRQKRARFAPNAIRLASCISKD